MAKAKTHPPATTGSKAKTLTSSDGQTLIVEQAPEESEKVAIARALLKPENRHGQLATLFGGQMLGTAPEAPGFGDYAVSLKESLNKTSDGDIGVVSRLLTAQAIALDQMFTEFARRASLNMGEYMGAAETYARLALKAQSNCRSTLEALAKLHQPREQTVRHVHVNDGGKAVIADEVHVHKGGGDGKADDQSHATGATG